MIYIKKDIAEASCAFDQKFNISVKHRDCTCPSVVLLLAGL